MMDAEATDEQRYPTLSAEGRQMLQRLREHPHAPLYRNQSGNRLLADEVAKVRAFEDAVQSASIDWTQDRPPAWLSDFAAQIFRAVPHYRALGSAPASFEDIASVSRADLSADIAAFVADSAPLDRMMNFRTSGTSGHPLLLASHPVVAASYLAFHKRALRRFGITLLAGAGEVGVVLLGMQRKCFTYVSVTPTMNEAGLAKINLHPDDWREPADRALYLNDLRPEVLAGDPISFTELLTLGMTWKPRALLCTSMALLPGLRTRLESTFECPVLDLYSMNEAGPIAVFDPAVGGHVLLQNRMFVEILDENDRRAPAGGRGEITLTGGFNFCLPLLRYRTGDFASLDCSGPEPVLLGFSGRPPVRYRSADGAWLNNIEVTHAFRNLALPQWSMHQAADGAITLLHAGGASAEDDIRSILERLFGPVPLRIGALPADGDKFVQYTSDLADPAA
ncbi:MAG: capsule biosynthesis protein CapK [Prosthecobacter sp.]